MSDIGNKEIFAENLKRLMQERDVDRNYLCERLGFKYSTFTDWVNANKYPRIDKIEMLATYFGVPKSTLIERRDTNIHPYHPTHRIPILGRVAAGLPIYAEEHIEGYTYTELNGGAEYFALRVEGDSMTALHIIPGCLVIVRKQEVANNGDIAVVLVDDEDATVKRYKREGNSVILSPQSNNRAHDVQMYNLKEHRIRILGIVAEIKLDPHKL